MGALFVAISLALSTMLVPRLSPSRASIVLQKPQLIKAHYGYDAPADVTATGNNLYFVLGEIQEGCGPNTYGDGAPCRVAGTPLYAVTGKQATLAYPFSNAQFAGALTPVGNRLLLLAGKGLWRSDGTRKGTTLVGPIISPRFGDYSYPDPVIPSGRRAYILGSHQIWITDGTPAGTHLVAALPQISTCCVGDGNDAVVANGSLFFAARDGVHGMELWKSDGTAQGTRMVADLQPGHQGSNPGVFTAAGSNVYFLTGLKRQGWMTGWKLWVTGGTAATTHLLKRYPTLKKQPLDYTTAAPHDFFPFHGGVFFSSGSLPGNGYVWHSDGTAAGTVSLGKLYGGGYNMFGHDWTVLRGKAYFAGSTNGRNFQLWVSDGTPTGTRMAVTQAPESDIVSAHGRLYYLSYLDGSSGVWSSDGTPGGSYQIARFKETSEATGVSSSLTAVGDSLYFVAPIGTWRDHLWTVLQQ